MQRQNELCDGALESLYPSDALVFVTVMNRPRLMWLVRAYAFRRDVIVSCREHALRR